MAADNQSPAELMPEPALLALARKHFGALSEAEEELFRAAQEGREASALAGDEEEDNPANAANWPADRAVRAKCISWVCTDPQASALVTHLGLELHGIRIDGGLDLYNVEIKSPFVVWKCAFSGDIFLQDAKLRGFYLVGCNMKGLSASRARIDGPVLLRDSTAEGEVNLLVAKIGGDLDCGGAQFSNANGLALMANGTKIEGNVFLRNGFEAEGEVNFVAARIEGDLDCGASQFSNAKGWALMANGAKIKGYVLLRNGFRAGGEVNLAGTELGGLDCSGAQVFNGKRLAFSANGAHIEGSVLLGDGFKAEGEVSLMGIKIGGDLDCGGAQFSNANGLALTADGAKIEGSVFFHNGLKAGGEVNLMAAEIGEDLDCSGAQLSNANGLALNAGRLRIEGFAFLREGFQAHGTVDLALATIGSLEIGEVHDVGQLILDLRLAQVGTFRDDEKSWPKAGNLLLDGFRYNRLDEVAPFKADSRKKWLSLQRRDRFRPQPYEQLAAVLRQMGHEPEARQIMIEKNRERARFTDFPHQSWWWYNLFGKLIGYGYRPGRAFCISLTMILLGTLLFYLGCTHGLISPTSENAYAKGPNGQVIRDEGRPRISETYPVFNAFFYSLESFTPLLKLDQSANWTPNANHGAKIPFFRFWAPRTGSLLRYYLYFHIASGWLLTSLWLGAVTGLVKT
jgi:sRNA-binding regulator protein Hfq